MKVFYTKAALSYFNELADILYEKNYFSYKESSLQLPGISFSPGMQIMYM